MALLPSASLYAIILASTLALFCAYRLMATPARHLPPGPKPAFLIGNILQMGSEQPEVLFQKWATRFGLCPCVIHV